MIQDLTNVQNGQTMFVNFNPGSYEDDVLIAAEWMYHPYHFEMYQS